MAKTFYVPAIPKGADAAHGLYAHTSPLVKHPHFDREKEAQGWLDANPGQSIFRGIKGDLEPIRFGPEGTMLMWPKITERYQVEIEREDKLREVAARENAQEHFGLGISGNIPLDPTTVLTRTVTIHPDNLLHKDVWEVSDSPTLGSHIKDRHIAEQMMQRGAELERMYHILARSGERECKEFDDRNPEHVDIMRKLCVHKTLEGSLEERTMQMVMRQIGAEIGVRTALELSKSQIEAEFNARLEALPPETPAAERVAVAMEGTLQKFQGLVPTRDTGAIAKVAAQVKGTINDLAETIKSERITEFELGLSAECKRAWKKVPEDDREEFMDEMEKQRANSQYWDEAAKNAAFAAVAMEMAHAAAQMNDVIKGEAYEDILHELEELELDEMEAGDSE